MIKKRKNKKNKLIEKANPVEIWGCLWGGQEKR